MSRVDLFPLSISWSEVFELCSGSGALEACPDLGVVLWDRLPTTEAAGSSSSQTRVISRDHAEELAVAAICSAHRNVGAAGAYQSST